MQVCAQPNNAISAVSSKYGKIYAGPDQNTRASHHTQEHHTTLSSKHGKLSAGPDRDTVDSKSSSGTVP